MTRLLFDEAHGELIRSASLPSEDIDTWTTLQATLRKNLGWEFDCFTREDTDLDLRTLQAYDVLFVGGPTADFSEDEVLGIEEFVQEGGGLLIAVDAESLWHLPSGNLVSTLNKWGIQFTRYLNLPPENVHKFHPHYITAGIMEIAVADVNSLEISEKATPIALIAEHGPVLTACLEMGKGRILAIGDYAPFADVYIEESDNLKFAVRAFQWLALANSIDIRDFRIEEEIPLGQHGTLSLVLSNPKQKRIGRVKSTILSDAGAKMEPSEATVRAIPPGGQTWLLWTVEPRQLGRQSLHLSLDLPKGSSDRHLSFDPLASFKCIAPIDLRLMTYRDAACTCPCEIVTVGEPFWAEAEANWQNDAHRTHLTLELLSEDEHLQLEPSSRNNYLWRWKLTAILPGTYRLALRTRETNQYVTQLVQAMPSVASRIEATTRDVIEPLEDRIRRLAIRLRNEFGDERITVLPFCLCSPEVYIRKLFPEPARLRLLEVLGAARREEQINEPLLWQLQINVAPTYAPGRGAFVPFDPWLAEHLIDVYALERESIALNLVYAEGMPSEWLEQNIAAFLIHEKYGHGFFFVHTRLGQQLAILFKTGFLRKADIDCLRAPYPREQFERYQEAIRAIADSSIIVNEGFAAWLETHVLTKLGGVVGQATYRREMQLTRMDDALKRAARGSAYLTQFAPCFDSRYAEGLEYFRLIEGYFGEEYGAKCAVQTVILAADIHLGITQGSDDIVQFALSPEQILHALLKQEKDDARSDMRLRRIHASLRRHQSWIQDKQESLLCHQMCPHPSCPVNTIIARELGW